MPVSEVSNWPLELVSRGNPLLSTKKNEATNSTPLTRKPSNKVLPPSANLTMKKSSLRVRPKNKSVRRPKNMPSTWRSGTKKPLPPVCPCAKWRMVTLPPPRWRTTSTTSTRSSAATSRRRCTSRSHAWPSPGSSRCVLKILKSSWIRRRRCSWSNSASTRSRRRLRSWIISSQGRRLRSSRARLSWREMMSSWSSLLRRTRSRQVRLIGKPRRLWKIARV